MSEALKERGDKSKRNTAHLSVVKAEDHNHDHDPGMIFMEMGGSKKVEEGEGPWLVSYADLMTLLMGFFALIASFSKPDVKEFEKVQKSATEKFGGEFKPPYVELAEKIAKAVEENKMKDQVKVTRAADGVTIKFDGTLFFNSGDFLVKDQGKAIINKLLEAIKEEIPSHKVSIEGHTDNVPIKHPIIASNWELSGLRAARIAQLFEVHGFQKEQLTIIGWGETKPELPNTNENGDAIPENQAKNRRVLLRVYRE